LRSQDTARRGRPARMVLTRQLTSPSVRRPSWDLGCQRTERCAFRPFRRNKAAKRKRSPSAIRWGGQVPIALP